MKILILEDEDGKNDEIQHEVHQIIPDAEIQRERNWYDYSRAIANTKFDLILLDLLASFEKRVGNGRPETAGQGRAEPGGAHP